MYQASLLVNKIYCGYILPRNNLKLSTVIVDMGPINAAERGLNVSQTLDIVTV